MRVVRGKKWLRSCMLNDHRLRVTLRTGAVIEVDLAPPRRVIHDDVDDVCVPSDADVDVANAVASQFPEGLGAAYACIRPDLAREYGLPEGLILTPTFVAVPDARPGLVEAYETRVTRERFQLEWSDLRFLEAPHTRADDNDDEVCIVEERTRHERDRQGRQEAVCLDQL